MLRSFFAALAATAILGSHAAAQSPGQELERWLDHVERIVPRIPADFNFQSASELDEAAIAVDGWSADVASFRAANSAAEIVDQVERLLKAKARVDALLDATLEIRGGFKTLAGPDNDRDPLRAYLRVASRLIDMSGRLRYLQNDAIAMAAEDVSRDAAQARRLLDLATEFDSSAAAGVFIEELSPARRGPLVRGQATPWARWFQILDLAATSGNMFILPRMAEIVADATAPRELVLATADAIRRLGLPQAPRHDTPSDLPAPPITAVELGSVLAKIDPSRLSPEWGAKHAELSAWCERRRREGITDDTIRLGTFDVKPGDWMLMRNPSPYNLFTDLSPGLFTHVGVVTSDIGPDGVRRLVLVDVPERGDHVPAINIDLYVQRSLHYVFMRHPDPSVAADLARAAREMVGNESQFDLNFRTDRILSLAHKPLAGERIHTYCAGLLLLCALQTDLPREEFFPIEETTAGGQTKDNLAKLGLSLGEGFISPTGALFSDKLVLAGRREPMHDPRREVEEAIFDHFAHCLAEKTLVPSHDLFQSLRLKMAEASRTNPLLARALAQAAGVHADMDLVSAAKAAAVVETLDDIAFGHSAEMLEARDLLRAGTIESLVAEGYLPEDLEVVNAYRARHADLYQRLVANQLSPRELRVALVHFYTNAGRQAIESRFFSQQAP